MHGKRAFIPAAGYDCRLPFYDPFVKLIGGDRARETLLELAALRSGHRVLEVGCGTGSLLVGAARAVPGVELAGLDPDSKALARAKRKAERAGHSIRLDEGFGDALPTPMPASIACCRRSCSSTCRPTRRRGCCARFAAC